MGDGEYAIILYAVCCVLLGLFLMAIVALVLGREVRLQAHGRMTDGKPTVSVAFEAVRRVRRLRRQPPSPRTPSPRTPSPRTRRA